MSTIKLEFQDTPSNIQAAVRFLSELSGTPIGVKTMEVVDAEEVKAPAPAKTPTPRPSRAKAKPAPVEEPEDEDENFVVNDDEFEEEFETEEGEEITADDLRALQATKIDKHRPAIAAHYGKLGAKGISSLAPENFQKMFDFLSKLK